MAQDHQLEPLPEPEDGGIVRISGSSGYYHFERDDESARHFSADEAFRWYWVGVVRNPMPWKGVLSFIQPGMIIERLNKAPFGDPS